MGHRFPKCMKTNIITKFLISKFIKLSDLPPSAAFTQYWVKKLFLSDSNKTISFLTINRLVTAIYVNDSSSDKKIKVNFIMSQKLSPITNFEIIITKEIPHLTIHIFRNFCGIFSNSTDTYMVFT